MKIYVLTALNRGKFTVLVATPDKNLMDVITAKLDNECSYTVTECDSDSAELFAKQIWRVDFRFGEIESVADVSDVAGYYLELNKTQISDRINRAYVVVSADDILSAIEIAKKKYQEEIKK